MFINSDYDYFLNPQYSVPESRKLSKAQMTAAANKSDGKVPHAP